jgi:hypothetical protein
MVVVILDAIQELFLKILFACLVQINVFYVITQVIVLNANLDSFFLTLLVFKIVQVINIKISIFLAQIAILTVNNVLDKVLIAQAALQIHIHFNKINALKYVIMVIIH